MAIADAVPALDAINGVYERVAEVRAHRAVFRHTATALFLFFEARSRKWQWATDLSGSALGWEPGRHREKWHHLHRRGRGGGKDSRRPSLPPP
jgi:hypothetical protein